MKNKMSHFVYFYLESISAFTQSHAIMQCTEWLDVVLIAEKAKYETLDTSHPQ